MEILTGSRAGYQSRPETAPEAPDYGEASCSLFIWCTGHDRLFPESDGAHMTRVPYRVRTDDEPRLLFAIGYLPTEDDLMPARWEFEMPESGMWSFTVDEAESAIAREQSWLDAASVAIRAFVAEHGDAPQTASEAGCAS